MKSWIAAASLAVALVSATQSAEAQIPPNVIGGGLAGAGAGAALGAIAGGGRGAATGALIGGTLGAVGSSMAPPPAYAAPRRYYAPGYHYAGAGRCGRGAHWVQGHHNRWGEWRPGHCRPNY